MILTAPRCVLKLYRTSENEFKIKLQNHCVKGWREGHLTQMINVVIHDFLHTEQCLNGRSTIKAS